jgi:hypothetical protein
MYFAYNHIILGALASAQQVFKNIVFDLTWSPCGYRLFASSNDGSVAMLQFDESEFGVHANDTDLVLLF